MQKELKFFHSPKLPYLESRYSKHSSDCYKEHTHDTLSIGAVENGATRFLVQTREYELKPNELAVLNPHTIHACNPYEKDTRDYHMIYLDTSWCKELQNTLFQTNTEFIPIKDELIQNTSLFQEFCSINHSLFETTYLLEIESQLIEWISSIFIQYCGVEHYTENFRLNSTLSDIANYLETNHEENISLDELATQFEMNPYTLLRNFKKHYDLAPILFR